MELKLIDQIVRAAEPDMQASNIGLDQKRWLLESRYSAPLEAIQKMGVSAGVILTHFVEVKLTRLGEDGGLLAAEDAYPGAGSGNQSDVPAGHAHSRDRVRAWVFA